MKTWRYTEHTERGETMTPLGPWTMARRRIRDTTTNNIYVVWFVLRPVMDGFQERTEWYPRRHGMLRYASGAPFTDEAAAIMVCDILNGEGVNV